MHSKQPNIAVLAGYWSTNIGNAFFQLGAQWLLREALPHANVFLIGDQPGYYNTRRGNPINALDYVKHLKIDALVILGPFCRPEMRSIIADAMIAQHRRGTKIIILAAGMMTYDEVTIGISRDILKEVHPYLMTTRDTETYELLGDLADYAYDGIDVATFVSDMHQPVSTDLSPYVVMNFDQIPEPTFIPMSGKLSKRAKQFMWEGEAWSVKQPRIRTELSYLSKAFTFGEAFLPLRTPPTELSSYMILRTDHRYNPFLPRKTYFGSNTYAGDIPNSYLNIYANSQCTFTNRVHACVATASYGNPAMLFTRSPRSYLLKRLGLTTIKEKPTRIDLDYLQDEKQKLIKFVKTSLQKIFPHNRENSVMSSALSPTCKA